MIGTLLVVGVELIWSLEGVVSQMGFPERSVFEPRPTPSERLLVHIALELRVGK